MILSISNRRRRPVRRAQGMTEYIIIVGLIAILLIAAVKSFSNAVKDTFEASTKKVNSEVTQPINTAGQTPATPAAPAAPAPNAGQ